MPNYEISPDDLDRLANTYSYHPPFGNQQERYVALREEAGDLATSILASCPPSRERSLALTKLEEVVMWANASIARNETHKEP